MQPVAMQFEYRPAAIDEIYELRFSVLRPKQMPVRLHFPGDDGTPPATWHFGAFGLGAPGPDGPEAGADAARVPAHFCGACLTLLASAWQGAPAIQLRGMAVAPAYQGRGLGTRLLRCASEALARFPGVPALWWCNARAEAIGFYERNGWRVVSEEFMIEGVGPHRKMVRAGPCGGK